MSDQSPGLKTSKKITARKYIEKKKNKVLKTTYKDWDKIHCVFYLRVVYIVEFATKLHFVFKKSEK